MKKLASITLLFLLTIIVSGCRTQPQEVAVSKAPTAATPETPFSKVECWNIDESGKAFIEWTMLPAMRGEWQALPNACKVTTVTVASNGAVLTTSDGWVWSGVLGELKQGQALGTIWCEEGVAQPLYAYKAYDCAYWTAESESERASSDPLIFVPKPPREP